MVAKTRAAAKPSSPSPLPWPAAQVESWPINRLIPYARNARSHSDAQIAQVAGSMRQFGWTVPVLCDEAGRIIAGHGRVLAARLLNYDAVPVMVARGWSETQKQAYTLVDNQLALNAGWDFDLLRVELTDLQDQAFDISLLGFPDQEFARVMGRKSGLTDPDQVPEPPANPITESGDVWILGRHRVMCGDSTSITAVEKLMAGQIAALLHADPPYGMGKQADGVENDNLYREELGRFQMEWWATFRPFLEPNASAYIWGNAPELWRLWYACGLGTSEKMELRNEIVWDKKSIPGMASPLLTQYPEASERCLFFQLGNQFLGNVNADDFPETWEPLRSYMEGEAEAAGLKAVDVKRICGCGMYGHWFSRSQFTLIPEKHYALLAAAFVGHFQRPWSDMKDEWARVRGSARDVINEKLGISRSFFDNAHETMRDIWEFPRVTLDDRQGHATPKPVAMMERIMRSSLPGGGLCVEPFGGSGATLIGAENTGRACYAMELQAKYVDVAVIRWQDFAGAEATLEGDGRTFAEIGAERHGVFREVEATTTGD